MWHDQLGEQLDAAIDFFQKVVLPLAEKLEVMPPDVSIEMLANALDSGEVAAFIPNEKRSQASVTVLAAACWLKMAVDAWERRDALGELRFYGLPPGSQGQPDCGGEANSLIGVAQANVHHAHGYLKAIADIAAVEAKNTSQAAKARKEIGDDTMRRLRDELASVRHLDKTRAIEAMASKLGKDKDTIRKRLAKILTKEEWDAGRPPRS